MVVPGILYFTASAIIQSSEFNRATPGQGIGQETFWLPRVPLRLLVSKVDSEELIETRNLVECIANVTGGNSEQCHHKTHAEVDPPQS